MPTEASLYPGIRETEHIHFKTQGRMEACLIPPTQQLWYAKLKILLLHLFSNKFPVKNEVTIICYHWALQTFTHIHGLDIGHELNVWSPTAFCLAILSSAAPPMASSLSCTGL